ncbi:MAG: hypothetical protein HFH72_08800 [Lachnospiraceae bacterium]|nr:hypothetical protein [Lachnospiraceae bacterium]
MERYFDELNTSEQKILSTPFQEYFWDMDLSEKQIEERIALSEDLEEVMLFLLILIGMMKQNDSIDAEYAAYQLSEQCKNVVSRHIPMDAELNRHIDLFAQETVRTTIDNIEDEWFLSRDRATLIAENEAQSNCNYADYSAALKSGKTRKQWVDVRDRRERETHREVGGTVIPIEDTFVVGNSLMRFAKDSSMGAEMKEIANCRCSVKYF